MRQMHFKKVSEVSEKLILEYASETIGNQNKGLEIESVRKAEKIIIPIELITLFEKNSKLGVCFDELTPRKKRDYIEYMNSAKKATTKLNRIKKLFH